MCMMCIRRLSMMMIHRKTLGTREFLQLPRRGPPLKVIWTTLNFPSGEPHLLKTRLHYPHHRGQVNPPFSPTSSFSRDHFRVNFPFVTTEVMSERKDGGENLFSGGQCSIPTLHHVIHKYLEPALVAAQQAFNRDSYKEAEWREVIAAIFLVLSNLRLMRGHDYADI